MTAARWRAHTKTTASRTHRRHRMHPGDTRCALKPPMHHSDHSARLIGPAGAVTAAALRCGGAAPHRRSAPHRTAAPHRLLWRLRIGSSSAAHQQRINSASAAHQQRSDSAAPRTKLAWAERRLPPLCFMSRPHLFGLAQVGAPSEAHLHLLLRGKAHLFSIRRRVASRAPLRRHAGSHEYLCIQNGGGEYTQRRWIHLSSPEPSDEIHPWPSSHDSVALTS